MNTENVSDFETRYARQIALPEIGRDGQKKIAASSVLVIGAGGLGSPLLFYLAAAGVGRIGIVDFDRVDRSNLQRQILYAETDVGRFKAEAAAETLARLNSTVEYLPMLEKLTPENADRICAGFDAVADATDSPAAKLLAADVARRAGKPFSYAGIQSFAGQVMTILPDRGPCLHCLLRSTPPPPEKTGPFGAVAGLAGSIQTAEILKILAGLPPGLAGTLLAFDALAMTFRRIPVARNPNCPYCGGK